MKTGIERMHEQYKFMSEAITEWLAEPNEISLMLALNYINYIEGIAFAALMAHKENANDIDIAARMHREAGDLRSLYYEKRTQ